MDFKLILEPKTPDEYLLHAERPLCGLEFVEIAGQCLRRNLDHMSNMRHQTLGNIAKYEISVPYAMAMESGWFTKKAKRYLVCDANCLEKYIFYGASVSNCATNRPVYPYYKNEVVLVSYIDELAFLETWRNRGYQDEFNKEFDDNCSIEMVPDADDVDNPECGDIVLDDLLSDPKTIRCI